MKKQICANLSYVLESCPFISTATIYWVNASVTFSTGFYTDSGMIKV